MPVATWHLAAVALSLCAGACVFWFLRKPALEERLLAALLPLLVYLIAATAAAAIGSAGLDVAWSNARLVPSVAFAKGMSVYSTLEHGPIQTSVYPPAWVIAYLPAAFASSPTAVIVLGHCLAHAYALLPAVAFFWLVSRNVSVTVLAAAVFEFFLYRTGPLQSSYIPHADAPALGFGLTSVLLLCVALRKSPGRARSWMIFLATGMAWLTSWTKQVMVPVLPAMALWVLIAEGFQPLLRFCGWAAASGLIVALSLLAVFPAEGVVFNTILLMKRCPWVGEVPWNLLGVLNELTRESLPLLLLLVVGASVMGALRGRASSPGIRDRSRDAWLIASLVALFLVPTSVLGRVKVGGWPNTLSPTIYSLLSAVCLLIPIVYRTASDGPAGRPLVAHVRRFLVLVALVVGFSWSLALFSDLRDRQFSVRNNAAQQAFDYLKRRDPNVYFPVLPLSHLMAQDVLYNYSSSIYDREVLARIPMSKEQAERYFPANPSLVCWTTAQAWGTKYVEERYFARYSVPVPVPELPSFRCLGPVPAAPKPRP